jgi:hypothetical protein
LLFRMHSFSFSLSVLVLFSYLSYDQISSKLVNAFIGWRLSSPAFVLSGI